MDFMVCAHIYKGLECRLSLGHFKLRQLGVPNILQIKVNLAK
jgi:hypothetical protein